MRVAMCCGMLQCVTVRSESFVYTYGRAFGQRATRGVANAVCCSVLQCVAVCCSAMQIYMYKGTEEPKGPPMVLQMQCVAVCCGVMQCVAVRRNSMCVKVPKSPKGDPWCCKCSRQSIHTQQRHLLCCSVWQCVAVRYNVLQCVAVHCSVS